MSETYLWRRRSHGRVMYFLVSKYLTPTRLTGTVYEGDGYGGSQPSTMNLKRMQMRGWTPLQNPINELLSTLKSDLVEIGKQPKDLPHIAMLEGLLEGYLSLSSLAALGSIREQTDKLSLRP